MLTAYFFVLGLVCGSFANAVVWRVKTGRSFIKGRSICPNCKHQIRAIDLIPVISWLLLRGKCRDCHAKISPQYPLVELVSGLLFAAVWYFLRPDSLLGWLDLVFWLYISLTLVILAIYDLRWMILPDVILVPAIAVAILRLPVYIVLGQPFSTIRGPLIAALAAGGSFYALAAVSKGKWMGGGDIKLVFLIGLLLGIQKGALALFLATSAAALIGGTLLITKKLHGRYIAFGPFLAAAALVSLLCGQDIIQLYLDLSGLESVSF